MKLSIIIVGLNVKEWLVPCLKTIFENKPKFGFEVIYVDNGSTDNTLSGIKKFKKIKIIKNKKNLGFTKANNIGARTASGKFLFFLNSDTLVLKNSLDFMVKYFEKHLEIGILGPKLYNSKKLDLQMTCTGRLTPVRAIFAFSFFNKLFPRNPFSQNYFLTDWGRNSTREVEAVSGAAIMIKKDVFEKVGGFDEIYFIYFEENDLCSAVKKAGYKVVYYPKAGIIHFREKTTSKMPKEMKKIFFESRLKFFKKHFGNLVGFLTEATLRLFEKVSLIL